MLCMVVAWVDGLGHKSLLLHHLLLKLLFLLAEGILDSVGDRGVKGLLHGLLHGDLLHL